MSSTNRLSPGDDYFNDLSRSLPSGHDRPSISPTEGGPNAPHLTRGDSGDYLLPRPKRIACVVCRKRKLKCDGSKPTCGTCARLGHDCAYEEARRKSGPKRGYVKALEARLAQVETLLKTHDSQDGDGMETTPDAGPDSYPDHYSPPKPSEQSHPSLHARASTGRHASNPQMQQGVPPSLDPVTLDDVLVGAEAFTWEMISIGIDEPLPASDIIDELTHIYFERIHPTLPMMHRPRYMAAMNLAPHMRPPICLRYSMWSLAASITDRFVNLRDVFYQRARKYAEADEMRGHGERLLTVAHCQCWCLITMYEFKMMYFPRAWMSTGRATRLAQMMGLHRLDGTGLDVKQTLPPPKDWTEREERRRTFWVAFSGDRYASIGTGWPMVIDEKDILSCLPASDEAFELSKPQRTCTLSEAMSSAGASSLSSFAGVVLMASLFGRNLLHLHRPGDDEQEENLNGEFWKRHRHLDNILLQIALSMPSHFRLPGGLMNPNVVFLNMNIHTATICLHQAAIFKSDKHRLPASVSAESKVRCVTAAAEIASIMRIIGHMDPGAMHPFLSFCLYVAARVFIQYLKSRPDDQQVLASLQFLLSTMQTLKMKNPLTESFLIQLDVDLEGTGLDDPMKNSSFSYSLKKGVAEVSTKGQGHLGDQCPAFGLGQSAPGQPTSDSVTYPSPVDPLSDVSTAPMELPYRPSPVMGYELPSRIPLPSGPVSNTAGLRYMSAALKHIPGQGILPRNMPGMGGSTSGNSPEMDLSPDPSTTGSSDRQHQHPSPATTNTSGHRSNSAGGGSAGGVPHQPFTPPQQYDDQTSNNTHNKINNLSHQTSHESQQSQNLPPTSMSYIPGQSTDFSNTVPVPNLISPSAAFLSQHTPGPGRGVDAEVDGGGGGGTSSSSFVIPSSWGTFDGSSTGMTPTPEGMFSHLMEVGWGDTSGFVSGGVGGGGGDGRGGVGEGGDTSHGERR